MKNAHFIGVVMLCCTLANLQNTVFAQTGSPSAASDSLEPKTSAVPKVSFKGYVEGYMAIDQNRPAGQNRPLFYNFNRERELTVNLAFVEIAGSTENLRFKFTPAFGTYMQANYAAEPEGFRYLFETNAGVRLNAKRSIWLDAGVLPSPFGFEGAVNLLQNNLTRSLSGENSPYYLSGARLSFPLGSRTMVNLFVVNGWQNIRETNRDKSFAVQVQHQVSEQLLLNYTGYVGNERANTDSTPGTAYRSFHDFYATYKATDRLSLVALFDFGTQNGYADKTSFWHTANVTARIKLHAKLSASLRAEYYSDPKRVLVFLPEEDATLTGGSAGLNYGITDQVLLRVESRILTAGKDVFADAKGMPSKTYVFNTAALSVYF